VKRNNYKNFRRIDEISLIKLSLLVFIPVFNLLIATNVVIPYLINILPLPVEVIFFITTGSLVFIPMFILSFVFTLKETKKRQSQDLFNRLRINRMGIVDWGYALGAFLLIAIISALLKKTSVYLPGLDISIPFMDNMPLSRDYYWILAIWLPFFFFNVLGEELWWRGYLQPKFEKMAPNLSWLINAFCWAFFHIGFGWGTIYLAAPMFLILPYVVYLRKNTTISIVLHAAFGAVGVLTNAFV
jgi:membrane protease YdiL (CAAX protease family)